MTEPLRIRLVGGAHHNQFVQVRKLRETISRKKEGSGAIRTTEIYDLKRLAVFYGSRPKVCFLEYHHRGENLTGSGLSGTSRDPIVNDRFRGEVIVPLCDERTSNRQSDDLKQG